MPPVRNQSTGRRERQASGVRSIQEKAKERRRQHLESFMRGKPINQPGPSNDEVNVLTPTQGVQRVQGIGGLGSVSGLLQPRCIWSGMMSWVTSSKPLLWEKFRCDVFRYVSARSNEIETDFKIHTWPDRLLMQVLPKNMLREAGGLKGSKSVMFCIQQCMALSFLTQIIGGDFVGYVKFSTRDTEPKCDIKALILWYMPGKKAYVGLIPKNQDAFVQRLSDVIHEQHGNIRQLRPLADGGFLPSLELAGPSVSAWLLQQQTVRRYRIIRLPTSEGQPQQPFQGITDEQMAQIYNGEESDDDDDDDDDSENGGDIDDDYDSDSE